MSRPVPKVGDVVEVDSNPDPELNGPHPSDWAPMVVTRMQGGRVVQVKAPSGTRHGLMAIDVFGAHKESAAWWRWPRWHLSTVLRAIARDPALPETGSQRRWATGALVTLRPRRTFADAFDALPFGLTWAAGVPLGNGRRKTLAREVHDAFVAYAEAHGIERDAP